LKARSLLAISLSIETLPKGKIMAKAKTSDNDMPAHESTYANVMELLKFGTIGCALIGALVVFIISR
jgi:hypothetical protein